LKRLIAFDLDGTLAESKQAVDPEMTGLLAQLARTALVAVISGGDWPQFNQQLISNLPADFAFSRLFLLPTSGTKMYRHDGEWRATYADLFSDGERALVLGALDDAANGLGLVESRTWGDRIEDRGSQITFSGLGQLAPLDAKTAWDADHSKRKSLQAALKAALPGFSVRIGGSTSIDITRDGIDKAYGMRKLAQIADVRFDEMIFLGDAVYPGGNDYPVREAGIDTIAVRDVHETKRAIEAIGFCLPNGRN
jgi:HAD superfamily hydrolase (TIGR01484 family)